MSTSRGNRQPWEYADGPTVGEDVPITSPPREEERPGVPKPPPEPERAEAGPSEPAGSEVREVRAEDPDLSPDTNQRLTSELREVVGTDRVEVPADRPRATRGEHPQQQGPAARLEFNWFQAIRLHEAVRGNGPLVGIAVCTAVAVALFCAVVAFAFQH